MTNLLTTPEQNVLIREVAKAWDDFKERKLLNSSRDQLVDEMLSALDELKVTHPHYDKVRHELRYLDEAEAWEAEENGVELDDDRLGSPNNAVFALVLAYKGISRDVTPFQFIAGFQDVNAAVTNLSYFSLDWNEDKGDFSLNS